MICCNLLDTLRHAMLYDQRQIYLLIIHNHTNFNTYNFMHIHIIIFITDYPHYMIWNINQISKLSYYEQVAVKGTDTILYVYVISY